MQLFPKINIKTFHDCKFIIADSKEEFSVAKKLFREYSKCIKIDLSFQNFENELEEIKKQYREPEGGIILIKYNLEFIGCAGIRKFKDNIAELKRMYIKPGYRGVGLGKKLLEIALLRAKELDYSKIYLDTLSSMKSAVKIYKTAGFKEIRPYRFNPSEDVLFFGKVI